MPVCQECLEVRGPRSLTSCAMLSRFHGPSSKHGPRSQNMCASVLTIFTYLEPTAIGGGLWFACEGTGVSTGGRARSSAFFYGTDQRVHDMCTSFSHDNAWIGARRTNVILRVSAMKKVNVWICARRTTTDHDLACVIPDKKESK